MLYLLQVSITLSSRIDPPGSAIYVTPLLCARSMLSPNGQKADNWWLRQCPKVLALPFKEGIKRADRDNAIDLYIGEEYMDVLADGTWENIFTEKPEVFTREEKRAWLDKLTGVALGSDAFFPFGDNIERAHKSGVTYIAEPGGSIRDDNVIDTCNKYNMAMAFTGSVYFLTTFFHICRISF